MSLHRATPLLLLLMSCGNDTKVSNYNTAPTAAISLPADGATVEEGVPVEFSATVKDNQQGSETLALTWTSDKNGLLSEEPADGDGFVRFTSSSLTAGSHIITLQVLDDDGASGEDWIAITVTDLADAPSIAVRSPQGEDEGYEDEPFTFEAVVTDEQDDPTALVVRIDSQIDGESFCEVNADATGLAACDATLSPGVHTLLFEVEDTDGNLGSESLLFEVITRSAIDDDLDGFSEDDGDCDDTDSDVYPGAEEMENGDDDDCDDIVDEGTDAYDDDLDGFTENDDDCDDGDADVFPGATEECNGIDDDCDTTVDEDTVCVDDDGDSYHEGTGDCDDTDATIYPGADETLDGVDEDCDGLIDEGTAAFDDDGDCYCEEAPCTGSANGSCSTIDGGDCDDDDDDINPDAVEVCDEIDNDCDGGEDIDAVDASTWYADSDSDGYGDPTSTTEACEQPINYVGTVGTGLDDCDDSDANINPGETELCDGEDDDCDGTIDEAGAADASIWYEDDDSDGYGDAGSSVAACDEPSGYTDNNDDCDDSESSINPDGSESCNDEDDDCDGDIDEGVGTTWYGDGDGDGFGDPTDSVVACDAPANYEGNDEDCDDGNSAINPDADEICDGADNDCNSAIDEDSATDASTWYLDDDSDGYGDASVTTEACEEPPGYVYSDTDCDDSEAAVNPGASEACDSVDNDCDSDIDEDVISIWYADDDGDGYGDPGDVLEDCSPPDGYADNNEDCDDTDGDINPETVWYRDYDEDSYGTPSSTEVSCEEPNTGGNEWVLNDEDCGDLDDSRYPGAREYCDGVDNNCDDETDEVDAVDCDDWYLDEDDDGYGVNDSICACEETGDYRADNNDDCYDDNDDAYPSATGWQADDRGDGSFDYNCDGNQERRYTGSYSCSIDLLSLSCSDSDGFSGATPSCGDDGNWQENGCSTICVLPTSYTRTQQCR